MSDLQRTQTQLVQSERMSSLGQLVSAVAYEVSNPINFISGNISYANEYSQKLIDLLHLYEKHYPSPSSEIEAEIEAAELEFIVEELRKLLGSMKIGVNRIREIVQSLQIGKGAGIGLAISHEIVVEKYGGKLTCISAPGEGTEFIVEIPLNPVINKV